MRLIELYYRSNNAEKILKTSATRATSLELQPAPQFRDVFGPVPLPSAFTLPAMMALHSALYARVYTSIIGGAPPTQTPLTMSMRNRKVRRDKGQKHKLAVVRKPRHCHTCVRNHRPNLYTCSGQTVRRTCQYFDTATS